MLRIFMAKVRQLNFNQYIENISRVEFSIDLSEITQKIVFDKYIDFEIYRDRWRCSKTFQ
jgi:hypothetical protein